MQARRGIETLCNRAMLPLLCILMADCCLFGAGRVLQAGSFGFRMILLALYMLVCCPALIKNRKQLLKNRSTLLLLAFCAWLCVSTWLGVRNGQKTSLIVTDWKGFIYLAAFPAVLATLSDSRRIRTLQKVMMYASAGLALIIVTLLCLYLCAPQRYLALADWANARQVAMLGTITQHIPRLFMKSSMYLVCGCVFALCFQAEQEKLSLKYTLIIALCLFSLLLSYTRSIYLGAAASVAGLVCLVLPRMPRRTALLTLKQAGISTAAMLCLLLAFCLLGQTNYMGYAFSRVAVTFEEPAQEAAEETSPSAAPMDAPPSSTAQAENAEQAQYNVLTMDSDAVRAATLKDLEENIRKSPLIGLGLGAEIASRPDGLNEYFYLDLMSKTGAIGLLLYLLPAASMVFVLFSRRKQEGALQRGYWFSILLGFLVFSYFNPYMNASLGILMYCCCLAVFHCKPGATDKT